MVARGDLVEIPAQEVLIQKQLVRAKSKNQLL